MPKKQRNKAKRKSKRPPTPPRFAIGDQVRVKAGILDPDYPDIPLGGWSGTVTEVGRRSKPPAYLIAWDHRTVEAMHPVFLKRCQRDDLEVDSMWLGENDIEPDTGEPVPIEQPTRIATRPLNPNDQDDRIRAILGVTNDDPLPAVDPETLPKYHRHLAEKLTFPFEAIYEEGEPFLQKKQRISVTALLDADEADEDEGLLCEALEDSEKVVLPLAEVLVRSGPNRQLVADYHTWIWNWQGGGTLRFVEPRPSIFGLETEPASTGGLLKTLVLLSLSAGFYGAALGAAWASGADVAIKIGAILLGLVGAVLGAKYGRIFGAVNRIRYGNWFCGVIGTILGAVVGGMLGAMLMAFMGALLGALIGGILGKIVGHKVNQPTLWFAIAGAMTGVIVQAWRADADAAWTWVWIGAVTGAVVGPLVLFGAGIALGRLE